MAANKNNSGALFKAREKKTERSPDYNGSINVEGKEFFISGWIKQPKDPQGKPFVSLALTPKTQQAPTSGGNPPPGCYDDFDNSERVF